ncbi:MAG: flippase [Chloroflexota bacterium]
MGARIVDAAFAALYLRLLGRMDVGEYAFLVVLTTYLDTLVDFGLNALVAREVARGRVSVEAAFRSVNLLRLGLWIGGLPIVGLVYGPLRSLVNLPDTAAVAGWIFYLALLPSVLAKTATAVLWAAERLELSASVSVLSTLLRVSMGAAVLVGGLGLVGLATASLITNMVSATTLWFLSRRVQALRPVIDSEGGMPTHRWLVESWPLFLNALLQGLFFKIDSVLLLPLAGPASAGVYAAAYKVSEGAGIFSSSFTLALFPRLSRERDLSQAYGLALRILLQVAFPVAAGIALLAEPIVALVGGPQYLPDSAVALAILIAYLPLSYANGLTQYVLIAAGRQRFLTGAFAAALVFNLIANLLLIPRFGYVGAAIVTVLSEVVLIVPFAYAARQVTRAVSILAEARAPMIATALIAPVVWWVRDAVHPAAAILVGMIVYPIALWAMGGIDGDQRRVLYALVNRA